MVFGGSQGAFIDVSFNHWLGGTVRMCYLQYMVCISCNFVESEVRWHPEQSLSVLASYTLFRSTYRDLVSGPPTSPATARHPHHDVSPPAFLCLTIWN